MKRTEIRMDALTNALLKQLIISSSSEKPNKSEIIRNSIYHLAVNELGQENVDEIVADITALEKQI